jgi:methylase of polypeptide subunit release factors
MPELLQRLPKSERLSIPKAGLTLLASTRRWAEPLLNAHKQLQSFLHKEVDSSVLLATYENNYSFLQFDVAHRPTSGDLISLSSSAMIFNWLIGRATGNLNPEASISEAEHWSLGFNIDKPVLSDELPQHIQTLVLAPLIDLDYSQPFLDILPYAAEVFETSEEILRAYGAARKSKRAAGVFYTPSDVSDYLVDYLVTNYARDVSDLREVTWLDPACGTGCFLLSVLYRVSQEKNISPGEAALEYAAKSLYGIDVSPIALQSAAYIIVLSSMQFTLREAGSLRRSLSLLGKNLLVADATQIRSREELGSLSSSLMSGVDFVISNPPYTRRKTNKPAQQSALFSTEKKEEKESESLYLHFVKMMPLLSSKKVGGGGMVVPLSIAYNTRQEFNQVRQLMWSDGEWHLAHYDRTPDSLFGDDVKTRNSIIFFSQERKGDERVYTTELMRWSSRSRASLFNEIHFSSVPKIYQSNIIPKIGDELGQQLLTQIYQKYQVPLSNSLMRVNSCLGYSEGLLRTANTAYNWLPFELVTKAPSSDSFMRYRYWAAHTPEDSPLIFSLLQSRVAYWLWRVWGDGFHLTDHFILSLPLSTSSLSEGAKCKLKTLGASLWAEMQKNKIISMNAGVESTSYCPYLSVNILDDIDEVIAVEYSLPQGSLTYLRDFIKRTIVAGREDEVKVNPALRKWLNKEQQNETHFTGN